MRQVADDKDLEGGFKDIILSLEKTRNTMKNLIIAISIILHNEYGSDKHQE